jgi:microcystin-dependent protein
VSRTDYAALFAVLSTTYGVGDNSTTFNLPDLRGRAAFGKDNMGGSTASRVTNAVSGITGTTLGATGGDQNLHAHTHGGATGGQSATHTHAQDSNTYIGAGGGVVGPTTGSAIVTGGTTGAASNDHTHTISASGSGSSQNMPPSIVLNYIIKT